MLPNFISISNSAFDKNMAIALLLIYLSTEQSYYIPDGFVYFS